MKVAVIGGGTAGCIMAAHLTKFFPKLKLYHIYDSSIPTIGVGEGTLSNFPKWLDKITGLDFVSLQENCKITRKYGIQFENWGVKNKKFMHHFYPIKEAYGYHISAANITELLQEHISAIYLDKKITSLESNGITVKLTFADQSQLEVNLAFDASGFPKSFDNSKHTQISLIPTNAALIRRGKAVTFQSATRSIGRPHGWIFVIPLTSHTSYGYVYNSLINSRNEIEADLDKFIREENVETTGNDKHLNFPNFINNTFFDGALGRIGNAACFLEPLEATALGVVLAEIQYFSNYIMSNIDTSRGVKIFNNANVEEFNKYFSISIWQIALFVGWHYACGSCFDTEFWRFAKSNFEREVKNIKNQNIVDSFEKYLQAGAKLDYWHYFMDRHPSKNSFAGFPVTSFYELGYGIGYF